MKTKEQPQSDERPAFQKNFKGYLILDYRSGGMRVMKATPKQNKLKPFELPISIDVTVVVASQPTPKIKGTFQIEPVKVAQLIAEDL